MTTVVNPSSDVTTTGMDASFDPFGEWYASVNGAGGATGGSTAPEGDPVIDFGPILDAFDDILNGPASQVDTSAGRYLMDFFGLGSNSNLSFPQRTMLTPHMNTLGDTPAYTPPTVDADTFIADHEELLQFINSPGLKDAPAIRDSFIRNYNNSAFFRDAIGRHFYHDGNSISYTVAELGPNVVGTAVASTGDVVISPNVLGESNNEYTDNVVSHETFHLLGINDGPQMAVIQEYFRYEAGITHERGNVDLGDNFDPERYFVVIAYDDANGNTMTTEEIVAMSQTDSDIPGLDEDVAFGSLGW